MAHNKLENINEMGIPDHLKCLSRNLYAGQEAAFRTLQEIADWFKIGKVVLYCQGFMYQVIYIKVVYYHPAYLTSMQITLCKIKAEWLTSWNLDLWKKQ